MPAIKKTNSNTGYGGGAIVTSDVKVTPMILLSLKRTKKPKLR